MSHRLRRFTRRLQSAVQALIGASLVLGFLPATTYAAPNACPASPSGLPDVIERATFCVYYDDADTTDDQATAVADHTQAYWDRYTTDFGFRDPLFAGKLVVEILDSTGCNGGTSPSSNDFNVFNACFSSNEMIRGVVGHELFHRVQYSYHGTEVKWFKEGTARAMEDLAFTDVDHRPDALTAAFSFNGQANEYLGNTNVDITSIPQRYNSALWWKYFTEQFGTTVTEPQNGVDAMRVLWESAETLDDIAALNDALGELGAGTNFDAAFRRFTAANWIKDLTNQPGAEFNYLDEDEASSPGTYGPIIPTNGGTISIGTAASFANQSISRYGARYFRATPDATNCPVVNATFHTDNGPAFYHVITEKAGALVSYDQSTAGDFSRSFFNDGLTRMVAIAGSTNNSAQVDVTMQCVNPVIDIMLPRGAAKANVGPANAPGKFLAQVLVTDGSPTGPVVAGLTVNDFKAKVNGQNALITGGGFVQQQYWLVVQAPIQTADGLYDLEIVLEQSGTATPIANDTNTGSVSYNSNNTDQVLVIDRSGSMLSDGKMEAAKQAARFYVDVTRNNDALAVVPYNENVNPPPFAISIVTAVPNVRQDAKNYINGLTASGATSIGDGMAEGVAQMNASPTSNSLCSFVMLSDGMENSSKFWADVQTSVLDTGCPVTSIALGAASDETLMQSIATATGGLYFYNDVFVSGVAAAGADSIDAFSDTALSLGNHYEYTQGNQEGRQRLFRQTSVIDAAKPISQEHKVLIDDTVREAVFALDWAQGLPLDMALRQPDGTLITADTRPYDFVDFSSRHLGWRIATPQTGEWTMIVHPLRQQPIPLTAAAVDAPQQDSNTHYQVIVSGQSELTIHLLLPARLGTRYFTGQRVPLYAIVSSNQPLGGLSPVAIVTSPNGREQQVPLFDDGQHGDGTVGDGLYGGVYTALNQASVVAPTGEAAQEPTPKDEGSYSVRLNLQTAEFNRQALGSFAVEEGPDTNSNGLPDPFEQENQVDTDGGDPDLDDLDNLSEYQLGTDPRNSDTDGGGENDGSEFVKGKDPFDPADDGIAAPQFLQVTPGVGLNVITYDAWPEYDRMLLYRATTPDGPWSLQQPELPVSGVYSDTADNGTTYFYRYMGIDLDDDRSAVIDTTPGTPSTDPVAPEVILLIDNGALTTLDLDVTLHFAPYAHNDPDEPETFDDIVEMRISNDPTLADADWQPFAQDVPWQLLPTAVGEETRVYAQVRDAAQNESLIVLDAIVMAEQTGGGEPANSIYLPMVTNQ
jgi:hypothetical protein